MKAEFINIRILNGRNKTYDFRRILKQDDFLFTKKAYGKGFWEKKIIRNDELSINKYKDFCKSNKFKLEIIYPEYARNYDYRKVFFERNKGFLNQFYICAYCGRIFRKENITVDHIFPIDKISKSKFYQNLLKWLNISNVNDYNNLAPACKHCNSKKGRKVGLWVLRGFLGRYKWWWFAIWASIIIIITYLLINYTTKIGG